jgi:hypothetical protein
VSFPRLLEAALAGTLRQDPPDVLPGRPGLAAEARLLQGASFEGLRRLAGRPLERVEGLATSEPAPPEVRAEIGGRATARLGELLEWRRDLLPEWFELVAARNLRLPHVVLPDVLEYGRGVRDRERELLLAVGGTRLAWLARQHPDWQFAAYADPAEQFAVGGPDERVSGLRRVRRQDPARGRELLQEAWAAERGEQRAKLLEALEVGLSLADEALLELAIRDARSDVRLAALRLIRRIPASRFGDRWAERARRVFQFKRDLLGRTKLFIREPVAAEAEWLADGLDARPPKDMGATGWLLQQIVALTPPSIWPASAVEAFQHSEFAKPLVAGLGQAAEGYADARWCAQLIVVHAEVKSREDALPLNASALYRALDPAGAEAVLRRLLDLEPGATAGLFNGWRTEQWSADFSRYLIAHLPVILRRWQYSSEALLGEAPYRLDPCVLPEAEALLDGALEPPFIRPDVERLVHLLDIRRAMREELA